MPRPGPRRPLVALRLSEGDLEVVDRIAEAEGVSRSEMIRRLLDEAIKARASRSGR
jgi:metal-responsive CopG/Arc/MetJ family transcriptional regulator